MKIQIANRYRPFSRSTRSKALIPNTDVVVEVHPTRLFLQRIGTQEIQEVTLSIKGPVEGFVVMQDLEKGALIIQGHELNGFFRYRLFGMGKKLSLMVDKSPGGLKIALGAQPIVVHPKQKIPMMDCFTIISKNIPRLSLGCHKKQEIEKINERMDLTEIFPFLHRLGYMVPKSTETFPITQTTFSLLENFKIALQSRQKIEQRKRFSAFYQTAIEHLFVPKIFDEYYLGVLETISGQQEQYSVKLLRDTSAMIESCFFTQEGSLLTFLLQMPSNIHSGSMINLHSNNGEFRLSFRWRSDHLREVILQSFTEKTYQCALPYPIRSFRLRSCQRDRGCIVDSGTPFTMLPDATYFLDRFQK